MELFSTPCLSYGDLVGYPRKEFRKYRYLNLSSYINTSLASIRLSLPLVRKVIPPSALNRGYILHVAP